MSQDKQDAHVYTRREFLRNTLRFCALLGLGGLTGSLLAGKSLSSGKSAWQIDPYKCVACGKCQTSCVLPVSAVKCVRAHRICGFCDLCMGFLQPNHSERNTSGENQICPTGAIERKFIEEPYFEYIIDEDKCIGCAKCVRGCDAFGNGSMYLQIRQDLCAQCNDCLIAKVCPAQAFVRVDSSKPYFEKLDGKSVPRESTPKKDLI